jgi:hypothetical protein
MEKIMKAHALAIALLVALPYPVNAADVLDSKEVKALQYAVPLVPSPEPVSTTVRMMPAWRLSRPLPIVPPGKVVISRFGDRSCEIASVDLIGPTGDPEKACPAVSGQTQVTEGFKGAKAFHKSNGSQGPGAGGANSVGATNPFYEDDSVAAAASWRLIYPAHCVIVSVVLPADDPQGAYVSDKARRSAEVVHRGMFEQGLADAIDRGRALCAEALSYFGIKQLDATHIRKDMADFDKGFRDALENYQKETGSEPYASVSLTGSLKAIKWLFAEGGTAANLTQAGEGLSEEFVFSDRNDAYGLLGKQVGLYDGRVKAKPGTEAALLQAIVQKSKSEEKKQSPGDVFYLALKQTKGHARQAALLAHNTLRSLARGADGNFTGVAENQRFFTEYLEQIRGGPQGFSRRSHAAGNALGRRAHPLMDHLRPWRTYLGLQRSHFREEGRSVEQGGGPAGCGPPLHDGADRPVLRGVRIWLGRGCGSSIRLDAAAELPHCDRGTGGNLRDA